MVCFLAINPCWIVDRPPCPSCQKSWGQQFSSENQLRTLNMDTIKIETSSNSFGSTKRFFVLIDIRFSRTYTVWSIRWHFDDWNHWPLNDKTWKKSHRKLKNRRKKNAISRSAEPYLETWRRQGRGRIARYPGEEKKYIKKKNQK